MSEPIKLQTCTVSHRYGTDTFACLGTEQDIKRHVGDSFCTEWWDELNGKAGFMPAAGEYIFDLYFEHNDMESADLNSVDLHDIKGGILLGFTNQELEESMSREAVQIFKHGMTSAKLATLCASLRPDLTLALERLAPST